MMYNLIISLDITDLNIRLQITAEYYNDPDGSVKFSVY